MRTKRSSRNKGNRASTKPGESAKSNPVGRKLSARKRTPAIPKSTEAPANVASKSFPIVGVGASAGGFEAFTQLLQALPTNTGMAFVLVQHLDPTHKSQLSMLLSRLTKMPVVEAGDGTEAQPNIPNLRSLLEHILPEYAQFDDYEVEHSFPRIGHRTMLLNGRQIYREGRKSEGILLAIEDITERGANAESSTSPKRTRYEQV